MTAGAPRVPRSLPTPVALGAEWYAALARGELRFQRCGGCRRWRHPPRYLCPGCGSEQWEWAPVSGRGELFSWTVTHQPLHPGFADRVPYPIVVVELEEGVRVVCGVDDLEPSDFRLGLPVALVAEPVNDEIGLLSARSA